MRVAAAVAVIGAVFAEWSGSDAGLGHAVLTANGQLETARAFAATALLIALAIVLYGAVALLERRVVDLDPTHRTRRIMSRTARLLLLGAALAAAALLAGCGEKSEPGSGSASSHRDAMRVMLDYLPNADHAGLYAAQAQGDYDRAGLDVTLHVAAGPRRAAQAPAGRPRRPGDLLRARAAAGPRQGRQRPRRRRRARAEAADLADVDRQERRSTTRRSCRASASAPPASRTSRPT